MTMIIGIDPGSRVTGFGIIYSEKGKHVYIDSGCVRLTQVAMADRLKVLAEYIQSLVERHHPVEAAVEKIFMHQNATAALKLGQARGAAMVALAGKALAVSEYSARQVKQSVVGYGAASKIQVQQMVKQLLNLSGLPQSDAADALAVAVCHAHTRQSVAGLIGVTGVRRGRWR